MSTTEEVTVHLGKKIKGVRELLEIKQETLAGLLGNGMTQQDISYLEKQKSVDNEMLARVAKALGVTPETIKKFNPEAVLKSIVNNFGDNATQNHVYNDGIETVNNHFNPIEKLTEVYDRFIEELKQKNAELQSRIVALESAQNKK